MINKKDIISLIAIAGVAIYLARNYIGLSMAIDIMLLINMIIIFVGSIDRNRK